MRFLASIQIVILLSTAILLDGPMSVTRNGCGCSASEQRGATCCCAISSTAGCSNNSGESGGTRSSCCRKTGDRMQQNWTQISTCCRSEDNPSEGTRSTCPCGTSSDQGIVMIPRLPVLMTQTPVLGGNGRQVPAGLAESGRAKDAPSPPPPRFG